MNYKFKFEYSWILVPLLIVLYLFKKDYRKYLIPLILCVSLIGTIETVFFDKVLLWYEKVLISFIKCWNKSYKTNFKQIMIT